MTDSGAPYVRVTCSLGTLPAHASATVAITVTPTVIGTLTNAALAYGLEPDPNTANNVALASVRVVEAMPPTIVCPANLVATTDPGQCSRSNVTFVATATDDSPGVTVVCTPPSGSTFAKGVTTVTCVATDASGNASSCDFTVTIEDAEAPQDRLPQSGHR